MLREKNIYRNDDICIIGMSGEFPMAEDITQYCKNLFDNKDCITRNITDSEDSYIRAYGKLDSTYGFDNEFFGISPFDAMRMDPQQRRLFESIYSALETSGYGDRKKDKESTGLCAVVHPTYYIWEDYYINNNYSKENSSMMGLYAGSAIATRIAYNLNLTGPVINFDDACASSLVGIHLACNSLRNKECTKYIVAASSICPDQEGYYHAENADSSDGYVRSYDMNGTGFVPGSASAAIVLKRYEDAVKDNDIILGVIKGSFVTNDGNRKIGFAAPGVEGEYEAISGAIERAGILCDDISYVEGHGTATPLGDSVEIAALKKVFKKRQSNKCLLGSVKSQIGHTDCVSGLAGIIKVLLSMDKKMLPATIHCDNLNEDIKEKSKIKVITENTEWNCYDSMIAGVSSFGVGGINSHVILQEPPQKEEDSSFIRDTFIPFTGKSKISADKTALDFEKFYNQREVSIKNAVGTYMKRKEYGEYRSVIKYSSDLKKTKHFSAVKSFKSNNRKIVFMFPGGGSQFEKMGKELYAYNSHFRKHINNFIDVTDGTLNETLTKYFNISDFEISDIPTGLCLILIVSCSLAELLKDSGVKCDYLIGESFGEYAAACFSGIISKKDALDMVYVRGELIQKTEPGAMLSICADKTRVEELIKDTDAEISSINCSDRICVSGKTETIKELKSKSEKEGVYSVYLDVGRAGHCKLVDPVLDEFYKSIKNITFNSPSIPIISTSLGKLADNKEMCTPEYWKNHFRNSVNFEKAVQNLDQLENLIFIECGTGTQLASFIRRIYSNRRDKFVISMIEEKIFSEYSQYISSIARIWQSGIDIDRKITDDTDYILEKNIYVPPYHFNDREFKHELNKKFNTGKTIIYDGFRKENINLIEYLSTNTDEKIISANPLNEQYCESWSNDSYLSYKDNFVEHLDSKIFNNDKIVILDNVDGFKEASNEVAASCVKRYFCENDIDSLEKIWTVEKIINDFNIINEYIPFIDYIIKFMTDYGYITNDNGIIQFSDRTKNLKSVSELIDIYKEKYPNIYAYMEFCDEISLTWNEVFTGKKTGNSILYPDGTFDLIKKYDDRMPCTSYQDVCIELLGEFLNKFVSNSNRKIKILEIGGGTGELTDIILKKIGTDNIEYTFSDIGRSFVAARKNFDDGKDFMKYEVFDVSKNPLEQGIKENYYDIIVCLNVVQATTDMKGSLTNIKKLLAGGGIFAMVETCSGLELINMIFGYAPGWWNYYYDNSRERITVSSKEWSNIIESVGFKNTVSIPNNISSDTYLFVANKENTNNKRTFCSDELEDNYRKLKDKNINYIFVDENENAESIKKKYQYENIIGFKTKDINNNISLDSDDYIQNTVYCIIKEILGIENINGESRMTDIGFDSLSALIFTSKVKNELHKEVSISDLYECLTIDMLVEKIRGISEEKDIDDSNIKMKKAEKNIDNLLEELNF